MRKLSGINFNNIYDLSSCSSYHNLLWQKFELPQSTSSKNPGQIQIIPQVRNLLNMFKTKYYIYIYISNTAGNAETQTEFPKRDWFSLVTRETQTEGKLAIDAMTQTDSVYTSDRNADTTQEYLDIDMIKLLKDEIAFIRGKLCLELR